MGQTGLRRIKKSGDWADNFQREVFVQGWVRTKFSMARGKSTEGCMEMRLHCLVGKAKASQEVWEVSERP